jgi:hypothetical protein
MASSRVSGNGGGVVGVGHRDDESRAGLTVNMLDPGDSLAIGRQRLGLEDAVLTYRIWNGVGDLIAVPPRRER